MLVNYYNNKGILQEKKFELDNKVFKIDINKALITQAINSYYGNQRQNNADTKDRSEVSGGGKKPWRQKGTGRARAGSSRSPIWKGGGVTFGPQNIKNYKNCLPKKMKKGALRSALSYQASHKNVVVFSDIDLGKEPKTKNLVKILKEFINETNNLIVTAEVNKDILTASKNLKNTSISVVNELNVFKILKSSKIILLENTIPVIAKYWGTIK